MKELFAEMLTIPGVHGVILVSFDGQPLYQEFTKPVKADLTTVDWAPFLAALNGAREVDLVYENRRLYIRKSDAGLVVVVMGGFASIARVRLNADVLLPSLAADSAEAGKKKGFGRFFKRK